MFWFRHNKCDGNVGVDITKKIKLVASFGLGREGLVIGLGSLTKDGPESEEIVPDFVCLNCHEIIDLEDILIVCFHCGKSLPPVEMFKPNSGGGTYCKPCLDTLYENVGGVGIISLMSNLALTTVKGRR